MKESHPRDYKPVCEPCKMLFPSRNLLDEHQKKKHDKTYLCQICNKKFEHKADIMKHMKHIHTERQKEQKFGCTICDFKEDTEEQLMKHLLAVHNVDGIPKEKEDAKDVNCPLCDFSSKSEEQTKNILKMCTS